MVQKDEYMVYKSSCGFQPYMLTHSQSILCGPITCYNHPNTHLYTTEVF